MKVIQPNPETLQNTDAITGNSAVISNKQPQIPSDHFEILVDWVFTLSIDGVKLQGKSPRQPEEDCFLHGWSLDEADSDKSGVTDAVDLISRLNLIRDEFLNPKLPIGFTDTRRTVVTARYRHIKDAVHFGIDAIQRDGGEYVWATLSKHGVPNYGLQHPVRLTMHLRYGQQDDGRWWYVHQWE